MGTVFEQAIAANNPARLAETNGPSLVYIATVFAGSFLGVLLLGRLLKWLIENNFRVFAQPIIVYSISGAAGFFAATYGFADGGDKYFGIETWSYLLCGFILIMWDTSRIDLMREHFDKKLNKSPDHVRDLDEDTRRSVEEFRNRLKR